MLKPLLNEHRAAEVLGVSVRTVQRWRVEGKGPVYAKLGKRVAYAEESLQDYIEKCSRQSTSESAA